MSNVTVLPGAVRIVTKGVDVDVSKVLAAATAAGLIDVIIIGRKHTGEEYYAASDGNYDAVTGKIAKALHFFASGTPTEGDD